MVVVLGLLREGIRQPREAAHLHPHREVLPLGVAGADVLRIGAGPQRGASQLQRTRRGCSVLARLSARRRFYQHGVIDIGTERAFDRV